jgi:hypothetical protein
VRLKIIFLISSKIGGNSIARDNSVVEFLIVVIPILSETQTVAGSIPARETIIYYLNVKQINNIL